MAGIPPQKKQCLGDVSSPESTTSLSPLCIPSESCQLAQFRPTQGPIGGALGGLSPGHGVTVSPEQGVSFLISVMNSKKTLAREQSDNPFSSARPISYLQNLINRFNDINGFNTPVPVTGIFDTRTENALKDLQQVLGVGPTGQFGPTTAFYLLPAVYPYEKLPQPAHTIVANVTGYSRQQFDQRPAYSALLEAAGVSTRKHGVTVEEYLGNRSAGPVTVATDPAVIPPGSLMLLEIPDPNSPSGTRIIPTIAEDVGDPTVVARNVVDVYFDAPNGWIRQNIQRSNRPAYIFRWGTQI